MTWAGAGLDLLGGLTIFLYAIAQLSETLKLVAGERMKTMLGKVTTSPLAGLVTGCVATTILDSSSVTIILVIALVHAGALTFEQSLGVILGSNIGTTVSSLLFSLEVDRFSPVILLLGLAGAVLWRGEPQSRYGLSIFFLGLLLFGLHLMGVAMKPLAESESLEAWMKGLENPLHGAMFGAVATAIIQSSSGMMGIAIKLAGAGLMTLPAGIAVMLGAEIGTCMDTLIASAGRSREAFRAGMFHLLFNVVTVCLGLLFYRQIAAIATWLPGQNISRQIANAHIFFNVAGAMLFLPLIPLCSAALTAMIPSTYAGFGDKRASEPA